MTGEAGIEAFISRWQGREGGQERANYGMFLSEFSAAIGAQIPDPAAATTSENDYVLERAVKLRGPDGMVSNGRIDLYKRGCFVLEAKQSREVRGKPKYVELGQRQLSLLPEVKPAARGKRGVSRGWDTLLQNARNQAETYARALPAEHGWPPFILVCDVGHVIEVFADFSGQGKNYAQFPDRNSFRIYLEDLRQPEIVERLRRIWTDPLSLDPARHAAKVTRDIADRLAAVSKALEAQGHPREAVAMFLMRAIFTMFAEDVELLPKAAFTALLERCERTPGSFADEAGQLWAMMDQGGYAGVIHAKVRRFNGAFFRDHKVLPLGREEIGELRRAAGHDWREVDPSIFGTLLERALDGAERRQLGAHYTPRAYVERLVVATVIEPLRRDWRIVLDTAGRLQEAGQGRDAIALVAKFHDGLCRTRILDPACGTGNFLYVALELMKRLEGEVLETLASLGGQEALRGLSSHTVDPHQFLGLEVNPRAAAIAELVLWIGYLQWHVRTQTGQPEEPILRAFRNIEQRDAVLDLSGAAPRAPKWPEAEFITGNPPFIGGKDIRARLGDAYAGALWAAHPLMNDSADFVMYWWDHAATLLTRKGGKLRRFGFVTTNSITQVFQRRVVERHLAGKTPVSLVMAVPDHPWTQASRDAAAVRIAMTVVEAGSKDGVLFEVTAEAGLDSDSPQITLASAAGKINADLSIGVDLAKAKALAANEGLCSRGMALHGAGFIVARDQARKLGLGTRPGLEAHIRAYRNGRDLTARPRGVMVIDLFGLTAEEVRQRYPEVYQHLLATVKPERDANNRASYKDNWWIFGEPRKDLRPALAGLPRYIATVETAKHRLFQFLDASVLPDNMLVAIGSADPFYLGILSSRIHGTWAVRAGGWLGMGNDPRYSKTRCFDPFPFPAATPAQAQKIGAIAEEIDALRKRVLAEHDHLTLTGLYNIREMLRAGRKPTALSGEERRVFDDGLVLILHELHERLDLAVAEAFGIDPRADESAILGHLVALNAARAAAEARGIVQWLRPEYQIPRFGSTAEKRQLDLGEGVQRVAKAGKPGFPKDEIEQTMAVVDALHAAKQPLAPSDVAACFKQGQRAAPQIEKIMASLARHGRLGAASSLVQTN